MPISSVHRNTPAHAPAKPAPLSLLQLKADYAKGFDKVKGYKEIADPERAKDLKGTKALALYKDTLGEGKNDDLITDGDHLMYRGANGNLFVATFPEDSSRGDDLWVFDKTGQKQLAHGTAIDGKLKWDAPAEPPKPKATGWSAH